MSRKGPFGPNSQKNHRNWEKPRVHRSRMSGQMEVSLQNQILRSEAKARQF
ncbi:MULTISPECIES: YpzG family protein [Lysinibacillus]|uniref:YpzG family protein n=1 Tax=Lysinibacillus antri TaxID=2498145 RepID=A0A432LD68_9BACI|nr:MULTISPECIES: YpzG family protein [Lysinibacillus]RUL53559.1 YpzG family protein [Lysinibacillus antri]TSI06210.1 YpzG family protein [Lysinibacillus sp. BW-2-10]